MKEFSFGDQFYNLWLLLTYTRHLIFKARQKELRQYDLTPITFRAMSVIQNIGDKATPADISRQMLREPHSVSELLERMRKDGLVTKTKDLERKNLVRVRLTEKGRELFQKSSEQKSFRKIMSSLSKEEREQLRLYLMKLWNKAEKELGEEYQTIFRRSR